MWMILKHEGPHSCVVITGRSRVSASSLRGSVYLPNAWQSHHSFTSLKLFGSETPWCSHRMFTSSWVGSPHSCRPHSFQDSSWCISPKGLCSGGRDATPPTPPLFVGAGLPLLWCGLLVILGSIISHQVLRSQEVRVSVLCPGTLHEESGGQFWRLVFS